MSREPRSRYRLVRIENDGTKIYKLTCCLCGHHHERGLPALASTGLYFTSPLRCEHCGLWSTYYKRKGIEE